MEESGATSAQASLYELLDKKLDEVTPGDLSKLEDFKAQKYEDVVLNRFDVGYHMQ